MNFFAGVIPRYFEGGGVVFECLSRGWSDILYNPGGPQCYYTVDIQSCQVNSEKLDKSSKIIILIGMNNLTSTRKLTEKQEKFLENLVETKGNLKLSAELAGYSGNHYQVLKSLREEVVDLASNVLAREAPAAAFKLVEIMQSDDAVPQANVKLQAAQTLLDRVGVVKKEKLDVNHNVTGGVFILPQKETIDLSIEEGDYEELVD